MLKRPGKPSIGLGGPTPTASSKIGPGLPVAAGKDALEEALSSAPYPTKESRVPQTRSVIAEIHTRSFKITGTVHVSLESYRGRLTDRLNLAGQHFIPVTDAKVVVRQGPSKKAKHVDCIILNSMDIEAVIPIEE